MLQELRTAGTPGVTIICDTALHGGRRLLLSFLVAALQRGELVHVIAFEVSRDDFLAGLPPELRSRMTYHDGFSDPLGWRSDPDTFTRDDFTVNSIMNRVGRPHLPVTIVLDSLSWLLARIPLTSVCHTLLGLTPTHRKEGSRDVHVLALVHGDLHSPGLLDSLCPLIDTFINVKKTGERLHVGVRHRRKTGKVVTSEEELRILDSFNLEILTDRGKEPRKEEEVDPTKNLTFNLRLSDAERQRKDSAALPYLFSSSKKSSLLQSSSSSAKIYYDPDPGDDIDDEDPDDDLDV